MIRFGCVGPAILCAAVAAPAVLCPLASAAAAEKKDLGKQLADEATVLFKEGKFLQAAELFERAFALNPEKLVRLRNAGRAFEEAGKLEYAKLLFERYLQQAPDGPEKDEVRQRVAHIDELLAAQRRAPEGGTGPAKKADNSDKGAADRKDAAADAITDRPAAGPGAPIGVDRSAEPQTRWHAYGIAVAGAAAVLGGIYWRGQVATAETQMNRDIAAGYYDYFPPAGDKKMQQDTKTLDLNRNLANATLAVGGLAAAGGLLWALWPADAPAKIAAVPVGDGALLSLAATF